jgi:general stress protein CsbA
MVLINERGGDRCCGRIMDQIFPCLKIVIRCTARTGERFVVIILVEVVTALDNKAYHWRLESNKLILESKEIV